VTAGRERRRNFPLETNDARRISFRKAVRRVGQGTTGIERCEIAALMKFPRVVSGAPSGRTVAAAKTADASRFVEKEAHLRPRSNVDG